MKKRLITLLLCVCLVLSGNLHALAAPVSPDQSTTDIPGNESSVTQLRKEAALEKENKQNNDSNGEDSDSEDSGDGNSDDESGDGSEVSVPMSSAVLPLDAPDISAESALVINIDTGDILYEKNAHEKTYPASVSKIMTGYLATVNGNVSDTITASESVLATLDEDATNMAIMIGEKITMKDLLYGMLLASANDASLLIADHISGSIDTFVNEMNKCAAELNCKDTFFTNPTGLSDEKQLTTAFDMAIISAAAYQDPTFNEIIRTAGHYSSATGVHYATEYWNGNQLIYTNGDTYYPYATGGKTGYTSDYKANLVSYAEKNGARLAAVVFGCSDMDDAYADTIRIFDFSFESYHALNPLENFSFEDSIVSQNTILVNHYSFMTHELPEYVLAGTANIYTRNYVTPEDFTFDLTISMASSDAIDVGYVDAFYKGNKVASVPVRLNGTVTELPADEVDNTKKDSWFSLTTLLIILGAALVIALFVLLVRHILKNRKTRVVRINAYPTPAKPAENKEDTADKTSDKVSDKTSGKTSDKVSDKTSDKASDNQGTNNTKTPENNSNEE